MDRYTEPRAVLRGAAVSEAIEKLGDILRVVTVVGSRETRTSSGEAHFGAASVSSSATGSSMGFVKTDLHGSRGSTKSTEGRRETTSFANEILSLNIGDTYQVLSTLSSCSSSRFWFLIDEWSSIPEELQPFLADFIRRCMFPIQNFTVQIAAIEYRSHFRLDNGSTKIGVELGSDIFADINLDDFFVYEHNPDMSVKFFRDLLYKHLKAISKDSELYAKDAREVTNEAFTQEPCFKELVRASEGVPRDFINILQIASRQSMPEKISVPAVRGTAKDWYERDKERNVENNHRAQAMLAWIRDKFIVGRKVGAFLVDASARESSIEVLFDERLLHIARRRYSARDKPGKRFRVLKID